jgi:hypothetical protein
MLGFFKCVRAPFIRKYGFHWVLEGRVQVKAGTQIVILGKGDMFCLLPELSYIYEIVFVSITRARSQSGNHNAEGDDVIFLLQSDG